MSDTDGLRQQLAAALHSVGYRGTESAVTALLPVVTAWAEQQARQRAAKELQAAAEELRSDRDDATTGEDPGDPWTYNEAALTCTQRADALADEDPA
jgi:Tfp pilus assembly protein PilV